MKRGPNYGRRVVDAVLRHGAPCPHCGLRLPYQVIADRVAEETGVDITHTTARAWILAAERAELGEVKARGVEEDT